jgi:hypothetical protein
MKRLFQFAKPALLLFIVACSATVAIADIKIKIKSGSGGQGAEQTTYIKGKRQRSEHNPQMVTITQCDLRRSIDLGPLTRTYLVTPFDQPSQNAATPPAKTDQPASAGARRGGLVTTTITATDTGERKQMFGYTARHIKTVITTESSPEACNQTKSRMETDGWYIDLAFDFNCGGQNGGGYHSPTTGGGCRDEHRTKQIGAAKTGYPVMLTTTIFDDNGKPSMSYSQEVIEISQATLDDALFDIPAGYTEVKDRQQMFSAAAMMSAAINNGADSPTPAPAGGAGANADARLAATAPKRAGTIRIGLVPTEALATGDRLNPAALSEATRKTLISSLTRPTVEAVALTARTPQQAELEAKQKECDFIVYTTVSHKRGGSGGLGGLLSKAAPIAEMMTTGGAGGLGTDSGGAENATAAGVSKSVKSKDELTLGYKLQAVGAAPMQPGTLKAKAKSDGEDLISPLAEQASTAVLSEVTKK